MSTTSEAPRPPLVRPSDGRVLAGVCRGIATHLGTDVKLVRVVFVILGVVSGAGIIAYLFLWALTPVEEAPSGIDPARPAHEQVGHPASGAAPGGGGPATARPSTSSAIPRGAILLAIGTLTTLAGGIALLQSSGWNVRAGVLLPVLLIAIGAVVAWAQLDATQRARWAGVDGWRGLGIARLGLGLGVVILGLLALATRGQSVNEIWDVALATLSILVGAALICAPFAVRLWADFRREQDARVRETERADIAAHLHDGVLQTLALIQRGADDPAYVTQLARKQERELRGWLYGSQEDPSQTLAAAATAAAVEVEELHGVPIEVVVTGDRPLDDGGRALVRALREALANAVRHGSPPVSAYVEIGPTAVEAFVRDHGCGFEPAAVPSDRLGVRESILGRMSRHGGTAEVRRRDPGTEVILAMPHADSRRDAATDETTDTSSSPTTSVAPERGGDPRIPEEPPVDMPGATSATEPIPRPDPEVSADDREPDPVPRGGTPR